jgi:hypothetical protein
MSYQKEQIAMQHTARQVDLLATQRAEPLYWHVVRFGLMKVPPCYYTLWEALLALVQLPWKGSSDWM